MKFEHKVNYYAVHANPIHKFTVHSSVFANFAMNMYFIDMKNDGGFF